MNIGVDIDGVLADYCKFIYCDCKKYLKKKCNKRGYFLGDAYDLSGVNEDKLWEALYPKYLSDARVRMGARWFLKRLKSLGHTVTIVTARGGHIGKDQHVPRDYEISETLSWLNKNGLVYDSFNSVTGTKLNFCKESKVDCLVDDAPMQVDSVGKELPVFAVAASYNKNVSGEFVKRKSGWLGILREIKKLEKQKNKS